jgi:peroxin-6
MLRAGDNTSYPLSSVRANEAVFFVITNIEHDIFLVDDESSSQNTYVGPPIGELGCWVDSAATQMVQIGLEHAWVPDVATCMGAGEFGVFFYFV